MPPGSALRRKPMLLLAGLAAVLVLAEAAARLRFPPPGEHPLGLGVRHEHLGTDRFDALIELVRADRPRAKYRILVTGGSAAAGHGSTAAGSTFPAQLETILNSRPGRRPVEVLNAGVLGLDSPGEMLFYLRFLHKLKPDMLIMFSGFNDLWDAVKYQVSPRPYEHVKALGRHQYVHPLATWDFFRLFLRSAVGSCHRRLATWSRLYGAAAARLASLDDLPMLNLHAFRREDAVRDVKPLLDVARCFQALGRKDGFEFVFVVQPVRSLTAMSQREFPISRWEAKVRLLYRDYFLPQLKALARADKMKVLDLNESLTDELIRRRSFMDMDFCHLDDRGYRLVAERVAAFIEKDSAGPGGIPAQ